MVYKLIVKIIGMFLLVYYGLCLGIKVYLGKKWVVVLI